MTGRRLTPGVEPAGAVERGMHGLSPGHPHIADCRVCLPIFGLLRVPRRAPRGAPAATDPPGTPRGARRLCREGAVDMLSVTVRRPRTCRWDPFTGRA